MEEASLERLEQKTAGISDLVEGSQVRNEDELNRVNKLLHYIVSIEKEIDGELDPLIKSANQTHKGLITFKKKVMEPVFRGKNFLNPLIANYLNAQKRKKMEEEHKRIEMAHSAQSLGDTEKAQKIMKQRPSTKTPKLKGTFTRTSWKWRPKNISEAPREYLTWDYPKITAEVQRHKQNTKIPGIEVYEDTTTVTREVK